MGPTGRSKILQVHPTRRCNLQCLHCYSSSGPREREALDTGLLTAAVRDATAEGYNVVSLSGGEPLLYPGLRDLLSAAKRCGLRTTVTSNGMLLTRRRLEGLRGVTDLLAISLDGVPESHNRFRANARAFETMRSRLPALRASGLRFGFIFTLTQRNLHELDWVARFALEERAALLQIHPLEPVGRATLELVGDEPDGIEASVAFVEAARIQKLAGDDLAVQVDLSHRASLQDQPARVYADPDEASDVPLGDLVSPLVIEPDGTVVPLVYGFSRRYALGSLHEAPLAALAGRWRERHLAAFRDLCRGVLRDAEPAPERAPFFNWYGQVRSASRSASPALQPAAG